MQQNIIFIELEERNHLLPLTFTRAVSEIRIGAFTFKERWQKILPNTVYSDKVQEGYLREKFPENNSESNVYINPCYIPNPILVDEILQLNEDESLFSSENKIIAYKGSEFNPKDNQNSKISSANSIHIHYPWDIFTHNANVLESDFKLLCNDKTSLKIPETVQVIGDVNKVFIEQGAQLQCCTLNTNSGSIYIDKNAEIMEGSHIRGALFLGENSKINMGSKIYGATTIGPNCKVGGEIHNSVLFGYSNKGHEGFLGNSVIGEWCNLGADTNNSNMKNNYGIVKSWSYDKSTFIETGLQFSGLIMGDHSKSAINTQFNTGTVCGVSANIFCDGFPPSIINHFSWGGKKDAPKFTLEACFETAEKMMSRRNIALNDVDKKIIQYIYNQY